MKKSIESSQRFKQDSSSPDLSRRTFVKRSLITGAGLVGGSYGFMSRPLSGSPKVAANDKIVLGVIGLGPRNMFLIEEFIRRGAEIAYLCDVDTRKYADGLKACKGQDIQRRRDS